MQEKSGREIQDKEQRQQKAIKNMLDINQTISF